MAHGFNMARRVYGRTNEDHRILTTEDLLGYLILHLAWARLLMCDNGEDYKRRQQQALGKYTRAEKMMSFFLPLQASSSSAPPTPCLDVTSITSILYTNLLLSYILLPPSFLLSQRHTPGTPGRAAVRV
jgi:hypothetical protein